MRGFCLFVIFCSATLGLAQGADNAFVGNWTITILEEGQQISFWLLHVEKKAGKLDGDVTALWRVPPTKLSDLRQNGDLVSFHLKVEDGPLFAFEGKLPKAGDKNILGSLTREGQMIPARMEPTKAATLLDIEREIVNGPVGDMRVFESATNLIKNSAKTKATPDDMKQWVTSALRAAEAYGPHWQVDQAIRLSGLLLKLDGQAALAVQAARSAEKLPEGSVSDDSRLRLLNVLARSLRAAGQQDQAQALDGQLEKLEQKAFAEHAKEPLPFKVDKSAGRKGKEGRAILVELFTGAQCGPCIAADLAFEGLLKTYPSSDIVFIQYHLHVPGPDPMTNGATEKRADYYGPALRGTPTLFIGGKLGPAAGGGEEDAAEIYKACRAALDETLDKPAVAKIALLASRTGDKVAITGAVRELTATGDKIKLRLALVEDWVRYKGRNGIAYHHRVVRAMPGGPAGMSLPKATMPISADVDLAKLRSDLDGYLDDFSRNVAPFLDEQRPLRLRDLRVVAFVQNEDTNEILQVGEVPVAPAANP